MFALGTQMWSISNSISSRGIFQNGGMFSIVQFYFYLLIFEKHLSDIDIPLAWSTPKSKIKKLGAHTTHVNYILKVGS